VEVTGFAPGSLGECILRSWVDGMLPRQPMNAAPSSAQRFLLCVLKDEGAPVTVDAGISGRSQSVTLLHVTEAP
jgi:hypothetical protein